MTLEDGVFTSFHCQNTLCDASGARLKTLGKVSTITQHVVGGHVVM